MTAAGVDEELVHQRIAGALRVVCAWKIVRGTLVLAVGCALLLMLGRDIGAMAHQLVDWLHLEPEGRLGRSVIDGAARITDRNIWLVTLGGAAYALLRYIEAFGLWFERAWAEWLTMCSGAVYLPWQLWYFAEQPNLARAAVLFGNLAIVLFMGWLRWRDRRGVRRPPPALPVPPAR